MLWIIPTWLASLLAAFLLGRYLGNLTKRVAELEHLVKSKVDKKPEPEEPKSSLIDPTDEVQEAIYQHKVMMDKLNGK